ncbi:acetyl-CoA synthetase-like protein [Coniophora puteana RWD-64-598 SS2]|uniref:Acetyl-CoA synthetase-like protein n=1 Tax=Coniophora puteana (strain RWD-64-598) TaxID=741705 RepID=A0A5M3MGH1_CONPW|nr:acetyl-CoA synthetase-like protein [Coniophora puteana RWD-64-598 SS2]EIW78030.1 acetyl-CoA synthetase-like protein [Coniophora puteana RWD-64-598 SS2]
MHHTSLYPPLPPYNAANAHHFTLARPDQEQWPEFTIHIDASTGEERTFKQFKERVLDAATSLDAIGIKREAGHVVGMLSENCLDYMVLFHALLVLTVPSSLLSSYATPRELSHAVQLTGPTHVFTSPGLVRKAQEAGVPKDCIFIMGESGKDGYVSLGELIKQAHSKGIPRTPVREANKDTIAYFIFSSGTSGLPKAVMLSHGNLCALVMHNSVSAQEHAKVLPPPPATPNATLIPLPLHHAMGLMVVNVIGLLAPSTIVILSQWDINAWFDTIEKYRVQNLYLVPSLLHQVAHHKRFETTDFSSVQRFGSGAAALPTSLANKIKRRISALERVGSAYGMSEATISITVTPQPGALDGRVKDIQGSVGILVPGTEARIVRVPSEGDESASGASGDPAAGWDGDGPGPMCGPNEPGELWVRGPHVALGYYKNEKATRETFVNGWLRTGDLMRISEDGVVYFEDRAKDTLKISGMQVSPREIEDTLLAHPEGLLSDVTVSGVRGGRTADEKVPRAWVVLSPAGRRLVGEKEIVQRLEAWTREALSRYKWLRGGVGIVDQIPKSPTGKVLRRVLVEAYEKEMDKEQLVYKAKL